MAVANAKMFQGWGLTDQQIQPIVAAISSDEKRWVDFMMRFELGLEEPDPKRAVRSEWLERYEDHSLLIARQPSHSPARRPCLGVCTFAKKF